QQPPEVSEFLRRLSARIADNLDRPVGMALIDIADRRDADIRKFEELFQSAGPLAADADHAEDDLIVRALIRRKRGPAERGDCARGGHRRDKGSPRDCGRSARGLCWYFAHES